jgi:uncharacterized protein (TIGR03083 family)
MPGRLSVGLGSLPRMSTDHIAVIAEQNAAFTAAVTRPGALDRKVLACPDWTVADLVYHLGEVQAFWTLVLREGGGHPSGEAEAAARDHGDDLLGWWGASSAGLVEQLRRTDPSAPAWCWWNDERATDARDVAWRQAHEVLVHRWDAEQAVGMPRPVPPELAADGVEEFVARYLTGGEWSGPSGVVVLRCDDAAPEWRVGCGDESAYQSGAPCLITGAHGLTTETTTVTAAAEQLDLMLWRRAHPDELEVMGDRALLEAFLAWPTLD